VKLQFELYSIRFSHKKYFNRINFHEIKFREFKIFFCQDFEKFRFEGISAKKNPKKQITITHKMDSFSRVTTFTIHNFRVD